MQLRANVGIRAEITSAVEVGGRDDDWGKFMSDCMAAVVDGVGSLWEEACGHVQELLGGIGSRCNLHRNSIKKKG